MSYAKHARGLPPLGPSSSATSVATQYRHSDSSASTLVPPGTISGTGTPVLQVVACTSATSPSTHPIVAMKLPTRPAPPTPSRLKS